MPELAEVERARCVLAKYCMGKRIKAVHAVPDELVFSGITHTQFMSRMKGATFLKAHRHGKQLWVESDKKNCHPGFHFGMTGNFAYQEGSGSESEIGNKKTVWFDCYKLQTNALRGKRPKIEKEEEKEVAPQRKKNWAKEKKVDEWPPRFTKCWFLFEDESRLAFTNSRRLGRVRLFSSPREESPIKDLGFDPLLEMPTVEKFSEMIGKRKVSIKALLLDQSFSAGVGNWIADEVLYQSRIHPETNTGELTSSMIEAIHFNLKNVVDVAVKSNAASDLFPKDWLFHYRWNKGKKTHASRDHFGNDITFVSVGGRTSAVVKKLQKKTGDPKMKAKGGSRINADKKKAANSKLDELKEALVSPTTGKQGKKRKPKVEPVQESSEAQKSNRKRAKGSSPEAKTADNPPNVGVRRSARLHASKVEE
eukprot:Nk52_evm6s2531 gene=Nk52_evmTU6s2531